MSVFSDWAERLRGLLFRSREEREMADEMQFHLERETAERIRRGQDPEAARRAAVLAFGGVEHYKEEVRDARGTRPLEDFGSDLRFAVRSLGKNPGFTATAVLVLGLGLGATTAVYSVMHSVVFAGLPYPEADRLVVVVEQNSPTNRWNISTADAHAIREHQQSFEAWGEISRTQAALSGSGSPTQVMVGRASAGYFTALGVTAAVGRLIQPGDEAPEAPPVMVLTHAQAERTLGGVNQAVGRTLTLDGVSHEVVGVLPPERTDLGGARASLWVPLQLPAPVRRGPFWMRGLGRLKPGVTVEMAAADLARVSDRLLPMWADFRDSLAKLTPVPLRERIVGQADTQVGVFAGAVLLVLLLGIANVATLILVRASARESEVAVRVMLGARTGRIARLLVTENLLLTFAAGMVGIVIAWLGLKLAIAELPNLPRIQSASLDWQALTFAFSAALVSGLLVSLSPVAALTDRGRLRADPRRAGTGRGTNRLRSLLVAAEFALALPLLVAGGLLLNSFIRLSQVDPGYNPEGIVSLGISLPRARYPDSSAVLGFWQRIEQQAAELPGTVAAGLTSEVPPDASGNTNNFNLVDRPVPAGESEPVSPWISATAGYFHAMDIPLLEGRLFTPGDTTVPVVVVSRSWARRYFPRESPVGRQLIEGGCYDCPRTVIIGVVRDVKNTGLANEADAMYIPLNQSRYSAMNLVIRSTAGTAATIRSGRERVQALDPELPVEEATVVQLLEDSLADPKRWTAVLMAFGGAGLTLSALGIFGLMSYVVRQRRREIGVRLALGAQPHSVTRLIVSRGVRYALAGSLVGLLLTLGLVRRLETMLFGVSATDAGTIGAVAALLLGIAVVACWLPGRRAARIRPLEAISSE